MPQPSESTVRKLYCLSRNKCAYPQCPLPLLDPTSNVLIAEVCHICADSPGGPRYAASQSDAERHGFENLIIMCRNHHKVIDSDTAHWTVDRLLETKRQHETNAHPLPDPGPDVLSSLLATVTVHGPVAGSVITTINQSGGQVAHQIINQAEQRRTTSTAGLVGLVNALRAHPPERFVVSVPVGHSEAHRLAETLDGALRSAGWSACADGVAQIYGGRIDTGIMLAAPTGSPGTTVLECWCEEMRLHPRVFIGALSGRFFPDAVNIVVGPAPDHGAPS